MTSLGEGKDWSFNKITRNWFPVILLNDISFSSMDVSNAVITLGSVLATIPAVFSTVRAPYRAFVVLHVQM